MIGRLLGWFTEQVDHLAAKIILDDDLHFLMCGCQDAKMAVTP